MNEKLESLLKKGRTLALAGVASMLIGCASMTHYIKPEAGAVVPVAPKEQSYNPSFMGGLGYGLYSQNNGLGLEMGVDYFYSKSDNNQNGIDSSIKTHSVLPRAEITFSPLEIFSPYSMIKPYIFGGASLLNEFSTIEIPLFDVKDNIGNSSIGINAGVGITLSDHFDARAAYTFFPSAENVKGMMTVLGSYRFLIKK